MYTLVTLQKAIVVVNRGNNPFASQRTLKYVREGKFLFNELVYKYFNVVQVYCACVKCKYIRFDVLKDVRAPVTFCQHHQSAHKSHF